MKFPSLTGLIFALLPANILPASQHIGALPGGALPNGRDVETFFSMLQLLGQQAHRRIGEEIDEGQLFLQFLAQIETHTGRQQRMSAKVEEVII